MEIDADIKALADVVGLAVTSGTYSHVISVSLDRDAARPLFACETPHEARAFLHGWIACCANKR